MPFSALVSGIYPRIGPPGSAARQRETVRGHNYNMKLDSIIKRVERFSEKIKKSLRGRDKSAEPELLIPGDDYLMLRRRYYSYKNLLLKNNELLDILSEVKEGIETKTIAIPAFRSYLARIFDTTFEFIQSLNDMAGRDYSMLYDVLDRIRADAEKHFKQLSGTEVTDFVLPIEKITSELTKETGGKAANLGEIRNILKLPTPSGFSITVRAYREFMTFNDLEDRISSLTAFLDISDTGKIEEVSKTVRELIMKSGIPPSVEDQIHREADRMGKDIGFAVRSSAIGEDGKLSFAGQFKSILNVKRDGLIRAYQEVIASQYDSRAIFYRLAKRVKDRDVPMAVLVLEVINAVSSCVLYTLNPGRSERDETLISAVWGLGPYAVNGTISPDMYVLDRARSAEIIDRTVPPKDVKLVLDYPEGVKEVPVPDEDRFAACLSERNIKVLNDFSRMIEKHFGTPQDIEWTIDEKGWLWIIQARPLHIKRVIATERPDTDYNKHLIYSGGEPASGGAGAGPVYFMKSLDQLEDFPAGAVLVTRNTSNELVKIMNSASAIITEKGSPTSHMATVAREFRVPLIINALNIGEVLHSGGVVTVDANKGCIYRGRIDGLLHAGWGDIPHEDNSDYRILNSVMKKITPLNLVNLDKIEVSPEDFQTIHDIIRYVHEVSVREMFSIGELSEGESSTQMLVSDLIPMVFYVIDLDGGVVDEARFLKKISPEHINSIPFRALWRGMTYKGVKWAGPVDIDMGGLASVMARSFVRTGVAEKGGKVYVILTDQYVNMSVKLAYHYTVFDAFCGGSYINNYINFRFQGGGASIEGRHRRALFIKEILEFLDFRVEIKDDMIIADIKGASQKDTEYRLDMLGRLLGCSRQLDMAIRSMEAKDWYVKAFLEGNYSFVHD